MGFGKGGLLDSDNFPDEDILCAMKGEETSIFRYYENMQGNFEVTEDFYGRSTIGLSHKTLKIGNGDSGSSLLNEEGNLIGVAMTSRNRLLDVIDKAHTEDVTVLWPRQPDSLKAGFRKWHKKAIEAALYDIEYLSVELFLKKNHTEVYSPYEVELAKIDDVKEK